MEKQKDDAEESTEKSGSGMNQCGNKSLGRTVVGKLGSSGQTVVGRWGSSGRTVLGRWGELGAGEAAQRGVWGRDGRKRILVWSESDEKQQTILRSLPDTTRRDESLGTSPGP